MLLDNIENRKVEVLYAVLGLIPGYVTLTCEGSKIMKQK